MDRVCPRFWAGFASPLLDLTIGPRRDAAREPSVMKKSNFSGPLCLPTANLI